MSAAFASARASGPHGRQWTGLSLCCRRYGLAAWRSSEPGAIARAWEMRAHQPGALLTVHTGADERLSGRFDGIEPDGALRLRTDAGVEIVRAGDVALS